MSFLTESVLVVATVPVLEILDHSLKLIYLSRQLLYEFLVTPITGTHRIERLLQGAYHVKQIPDGGLQAVYLVDVILAFHIRN